MKHIKDRKNIQYSNEQPKRTSKTCKSETNQKRARNVLPKNTHTHTFSNSLSPIHHAYTHSLYYYWFSHSGLPVLALSFFSLFFPCVFLSALSLFFYFFSVLPPYTLNSLYFIHWSVRVVVWFSQREIERV